MCGGERGPAGSSGWPGLLPVESVRMGHFLGSRDGLVRFVIVAVGKTRANMQEVKAPGSGLVSLGSYVHLGEAP